MIAVPHRISASVEKFLLLVIITLSITGAVLAQAQASTADLTGTVVDPNGAVVAGATVIAKNAGTGITRSVTTGDDGTYRFIGLPPGEYEITSEAATFKKVAISPVKLTVGQSAELKISMEIGAQDAVVNISANRGRHASWRVPAWV